MSRTPALITQLGQEWLNPTKIDALANALIKTGRLLNGINSMITEVTFLCYTFF
jgi:hypothetical protein